LSSVPENENRGESKTNWKVRIRPKLSIFLFFFRMCRDGWAERGSLWDGTDCCCQHCDRRKLL